MSADSHWRRKRCRSVIVRIVGGAHAWRSTSRFRSQISESVESVGPAPQGIRCVRQAIQSVVCVAGVLAGDSVHRSGDPPIVRCRRVVVRHIHRGGDRLVGELVPADSLRALDLDGFAAAVISTVESNRGGQRCCNGTARLSTASRRPMSGTQHIAPYRLAQTLD
jgi:hypothetical protein